MNPTNLGMSLFDLKTNSLGLKIDSIWSHRINSLLYKKINI